MKVKFENGYEADINDEIAKRMIKKGQCEAIQGGDDTPLEKMNKDQLLAVANEELNLGLPKATNKDDLILAIMEAKEGAPEDDGSGDDEKGTGGQE